MKEAVDYVIKKFGKIDVLMNLAGAGKPIAATDVTVEQWEGIFNVFLRSTFLFARPWDGTCWSAARAALLMFRRSHP